MTSIRSYVSPVVHQEVTATIRSTGNGRFYISLGCTRLRNEYKTPATAERAAKAKGYAVTIDPGADPSLVSVTNLCTFVQMAGYQILRINLDKYGDKPQEVIEFRSPDAVKTANPFLVKMGFKPVRITYNMLNQDAGPIVIDADTPSYCDVGSETYWSM